MITKNPKNILLADDSLFFRTKLSDILMEAGHNVRFARDGREVIAEVKLNAGWIDLMILDLQMPDIDGFGVLEWLGDNGFMGRFPVLIITGVYELARIMDTLKSLGATGLMSKGFTPEQIIFRINRVLFPDKGTEGTPRERVPVSVPVDFTLGKLTRTGFILNISDSGVFLHTKAELLVGSVLRLKFSLPGSEKVIDARAIVKWGTSEVASKALFGGYGMMFSTISAEDQAMISAFVMKEIKKVTLE